MKFVKRVLSIILIVVVLAGCGTPVKTTPIIEQEALLQPCADDTVLPQGTDGAALLEALLQYQKMYSVCAIRHDALINTIKTLKSTTKVTLK